MIDTYIDLFLSKDPYYTYKQTLDDKDFILTFRYSKRAKSWYMDLADSDKTPLVLGVRLVPEYPLFEDYVINDLDGFFWLSPDVPSNINTFYEQPENLPDFFTLRYFFSA